MEKLKKFFKALGAFVVIGLLLAIVVLCVIGELFPALLPDWMFVVCSTATLPFWTWFFVVIFKQWHAQRKEKKRKKQRICP